MTKSETPVLRICLFGGFTVSVGDETVTKERWRHRNSARNLLKLLALAPSHVLNKDQICDALWPESLYDSAAAQLRKAVHTVRHALEPGLTVRQPSAYLQVDQSTIRLIASRITIDLDEFRSRARDAILAGDEVLLESALAVHSGDLLPEDLYELWTEDARREDQHLYRALVTALAAAAESRGANPTALHYFKLLVALDRTDETAHAKVIRLHLRAGSRHAALVAYRDCRRALQEELGAEPSAEVEALHKELTSGHVQTGLTDSVPLALPDQITRPAAELEGRHEFKQEFGHLLSQAASSAGCVVFLRGEPGAGKTRLAIEFGRMAVEMGSRVLWGSAFEEEGLVPYSVFADVISSYVASLTPAGLQRFAASDSESGYSELLSLLRLRNTETGIPQAAELRLAESAQTDQARLTAGILDWMSDLAVENPLVLVLDDIHLADPASWQLLRQVARRAVSMPWLILATCRQSETAGDGAFAKLCRGLNSQGLVRWMEIVGLPPDESTRLAQRLLVAEGWESTEAARTARRVQEWSAGNPLFISELAQVLSRMPSSPETVDSSRVPSEAFPDDFGELPDLGPRLTALIEQRLEQISPESRRVLTLAAAAGLQWPFQLVLSAGETCHGPAMTEGRLIDLLDEGLTAHVLEEVAVGGSWGYAFRHPLIQAALYASVSRRRAMHFHRSLAGAIVDLTPHEVETIAFHYGRSDDLESAVRYLKLAADRSMALYANEAALSYVAEVVSILQRQGNRIEAAREEIRLGQCLTRLARFEDARETLTGASRILESAGELQDSYRAKASLALMEGEATRAPEGIEILSPLLAAVDETQSPLLKLEILNVMSRLTFQAGDYEGSLDAARQMLSAADELDDGASRTYFESVGKSCLGTVLLMLGAWEEARATLVEAADLAEAAEDIPSLSRSLNNLGSAYSDAGRFPEAAQYLQRALEVARRQGEPAIICWQLCVMANVQNLLGEWKSSESLLLEALELLSSMESTWVAPYPRVQLAAQYIHQNQIHRAEDLLREAEDLIRDSQDMQVIRWLAGRHAVIALQSGRAYDAIARLEPVLDRPGVEEADVTNLLPLLADALVEIDLVKARNTAQDAVRRARAQNDKVSLVDALDSRSKVALAEGDLEAAQRNIAELLGLTNEMRYPFAEASGLMLRGRLRQAKGDAAAAAADMASALDICGRLNATALADKIASFRERLNLEKHTPASS